MKRMRLLHVLNKLKDMGELTEIRDEVQGEDITYISRRYDEGPTFLFRKITFGKMPIVTNVCNTRRKMMKFVNVNTEEELYKKIIEANENPLEGEIKDLDAASFTWFEGEGDLKRIPIFKYYPKDAGPYITSGIVIAKSVRAEIYNASIHRMLLIGENKLAIRIVPRHLWRLYQEAINRGEDLLVAVLIGVHPAILLAAACSPPFGINELFVANAMLNGSINFVRLPESGLLVPAEVEIVLEGRITKEESWEGPFADILDIYDIRRLQPVLVVDKIWISKDAVYHAIVPASAEHRILMGLYKEALIWDSVRKVVPKVSKVRLTRGGCGWLHAAISIEKSCEGDSKNAILAAFAAHPSLKMVIVVDSDVDVDDPYQIEWALATRFQPEEDLVLIKGARGSSLDPSADQKRLLTSKLGIDATKPLLKPSHLFEKTEIIPSERAKSILNKLRGGTLKCI